MKILIVQTSFIGDTILSTPVIRAIKEFIPKAQVTIMTTPASKGLFTCDPMIDDILVFDKRGREKGMAGILKKARDLKSQKFDRVYSLHRSYRTALMLFFARIPVRIGFSDAKLAFLYTQTLPRAMDGHAAISNLSILFGMGKQRQFNTALALCPPPQKDLTDKTSCLTKHLGNNYAVLAPGSAWKTKQWHVQGYIETGRHLKNKGIQIVLIGGPADTAVCKQIAAAVDAVDLSGAIPLPDTIYMVANSRLLICNDSMALHMGSALKTPTVVVFCATSPAFGFGPWQNENAVVVQAENLACKPCRRHGSLSCPNKTEACMTLSSKTVITACDRLLEKTSDHRDPA